MVTFVKFMERLARGQLKNTPAVEETNLGEICPDYAPTILNLTNQGLVEISTRIPLIRKLFDLTFVTDQFLYLLENSQNYLTTDGLGDFVDNAFVKVLEIYDEAGLRYQPNTGGHITSPTFNSLRFSQSWMDDFGPKVRVQYQAKHLEIANDGTIDLPPNLITALQLYVAAAYISDIGGKEHLARGDGYYAQFLRNVTEDEFRNTSGSSKIEDIPKFEDQGWV